MVITTHDLKRAILNGGDISTFAETYSKVLNGTPVPVISQFDSASRIPSPTVLIDRKNYHSANILSLYEKNTTPGNIPYITPEFKFVTLSNCNVSACRNLVNTIDEFNPDVIALECFPYELSAHTVYAFSMACALGLSAQFEVFQSSGKPNFSGIFHPGGTIETTIIGSWLRRIPLVPVGKSSQNSNKDYYEEIPYVASRIADIISSSAVSNQKLRLLAVISPECYQDVKNLVSSPEYIISDDLYVPSTIDITDNQIITVQGIENPGDNHDTNSPELPLAQQLFLNEFEKKIQLLKTEQIPPDNVIKIIIDIVTRLRNHQEVTKGPSVRGTIALREILDSFSNLKSGMTRDCISKAALIALPARVTIKHKQQEEKVITDIIKEVLYEFTFSGEQDILLVPEHLLTDNITSRHDKTGSSNRQNLETEQTKSFTVIPDTRDDTGTVRNQSKMQLNETDIGNRYYNLKKTVISMIEDLKSQLLAGMISTDEYEQRKQALMTSLKKAVKPQLSMSNRELAGTIIEMMDAQDKIWDKNLSFQRMNVYYHIKGSCERAEISPFKQDYHALQWIIDELHQQNVLKPDNKDSEFLLTGFALDFLINYLIDKNVISNKVESLKRLGEAFSNDRSHDTRRFSRGDTFRDVSVRHTLKEIARKKKKLSDIGYSDLRVFLKERRKPQTDIVFCIDTSGSMGFNQRLTYARLVAGGLATAALHDGNRAGVVSFSDNSQTKVSLTGKDCDSVLNGIAGLFANGNTNIGDGIKSARDLLLNSHNNNQKLIVLLTDGQASAVSQTAFEQLKLLKERDLTEESAYYETRKAIAGGIRVSVVYFAPKDGKVELFIKNIARIGKGKIYRFTGLSDLKTMLCS